MRYRTGGILRFGALAGLLGGLVIGAVVLVVGAIVDDGWYIVFAGALVVVFVVAPLGAIIGLASSAAALGFVRRSRVGAVIVAALVSGVLLGTVLAVYRLGATSVLVLSVIAAVAGAGLAIVGLRRNLVTNEETPAERRARERYGDQAIERF
jgi:hypothetical protein